LLWGNPVIESEAFKFRDSGFVFDGFRLSSHQDASAGAGRGIPFVNFEGGRSVHPDGIKFFARSGSKSDGSLYVFQKDREDQGLTSGDDGDPPDGPHFIKRWHSSSVKTINPRRSVGGDSLIRYLLSSSDPMNDGRL
jgi:hypothetical protein